MSITRGAGSLGESAVDHWDWYAVPHRPPLER